MRAIPAASITNPGWLEEQLAAAGRRYGHSDRAVLGVLWWYSASMVLLGPPVETLVATGRAVDPGLANLILHLHADGRLLQANAVRACDPGAPHDPIDVGRRMGVALGEAIDAVSTASGARARTLWAIAADSLANRLLWAGTATGRVAHATALADPLATGIGVRMPRPRYVDIAGRRFVRRTSCCLVYLPTGGEKCTSCPRQPPEERLRRLRHLAESN